jgi:hypothetical protein
VTPGALRRNRKSRETRPDESKRLRAKKRTGGKKKENMRGDLGLVAENGTGDGVTRSSGEDLDLLVIGTPLQVIVSCS